MSMPGSLPPFSTNFGIDSSAVFETVARVRERRTESDEIAVRLRVCVADANGDWRSLVDRAARGRAGRRQATLIYARHGRYLAWNVDPEGADKSYRLGIDQACQAELNGEAAAALRSIAAVGFHYGRPERDLQRTLDQARVVGSLGGDYLQSSYDYQAAALSELENDRLPLALRDLKASLRLSIVSGRLASELEAHALLGRLYSKADEIALATRHDVRAGALKAVQQLLAPVAAYVDCTEALSGRAPWERATAFAALAAEADLVPDDHVDPLARLALDSTKGERQGIFAPSVWLGAYGLLAALSRRIPEGLVEPLLRLLQPQITREANTYRYNDEQHVKIVAGLFLSYPRQRNRIGQHLLALMVASPELGRDVLLYGGDTIRSAPDALLPGLRRLADEGCQAALDTLLDLKEEHPLLVREARRLLDAFLTRPPRSPRTYVFGTALPRTAAFVLLLTEGDRLRFAEAVMNAAEDRSDIDPNRTQALTALSIVARSLPAPVRSSFFDRTMAIAGAPNLSEVDERFKARSHPLSTFRINLGFGSLVPAAVRTGAALAYNPEQYRDVAEAAVSLFRAGDDSATNQAAHALNEIPRDDLKIDISLLASLPNRWARQLAAVQWTIHPDEAPALGRALATDTDPRVRQVLAEALTELEARSPDVAAELRAALLGDRSASVRAAARMAGRADR